MRGPPCLSLKQRGQVCVCRGLEFSNCLVFFFLTATGPVWFINPEKNFLSQPPPRFIKKGAGGLYFFLFLPFFFHNRFYWSVPIKNEKTLFPL